MEWKCQVSTQNKYSIVHNKNDPFDILDIEESNKTKQEVRKIKYQCSSK